MAHSALILAGGLGSRLGYREKALIDINGGPLIACVLKNVEKAVDNILISVRDAAQGALLEPYLPGYRFVYDSHKNIGPLDGILSGLEACEDECCFVAACDMPFINEKVVKMLFGKSKHYEACVPRREDGFLEPLHAVYKCMPMLRETRKAIDSGKTVILAPISRLNVNYVGMDEIRKLDPDLKTFMNINTYEDIQQISNVQSQ